MTRLKPVAWLAGLGFASLTTLALQGYSAGGQAWPNGQALYYINGSNGDVSGAAARTAIQQGADAWDTQTNGSFEFVYAGTTTASTISNDGEFNVFFRDDSSGNAIASSYRWWNGAGEIVDSDIVFWDASNTFFTGSSGCSGGAYIEDVAAHEFGHSLGLGHSSVSGATMYPSYSTCSKGMRTLAADDIAGVESLYPPSGSTQPPTAPSSLTAAVSDTDPEDTVDLVWNDTSHNEDGFTIERALDGSNFLFLAQNNANDSTYSDGNLNSGTTYWYRVKATNSGGESGLSNIASAQTEAPAPPNVPNAPAGLSANPNSGSPEDKIDLSWNDMSNDEDTFTIERSTNGSSFQMVGQNSANDTTYTDTGLTSGTTFWYRVMAVNASGSSSASNIASTQTTTPPPPPPPIADAPSAPTNPSPADGSTFVSRNADLQWSGDSNAETYDVYFGQSNPPPLYQSGVTSTSLNLSRLPRNKNFYWRVVAVNSGGSASSSLWYFSTGGGTSETGGGGPGNGKGKGKKK